MVLLHNDAQDTDLCDSVIHEGGIIEVKDGASYCFEAACGDQCSVHRCGVGPAGAGQTETIS